MSIYEFYRIILIFSFSLGAPSRWKSDDNMLADCSDMNHDNNKVSRSGSSRFLRGKKNTWVCLNFYHFKTNFQQQIKRKFRKE